MKGVQIFASRSQTFSLCFFQNIKFLFKLVHSEWKCHSQTLFSSFYLKWNYDVKFWVWFLTAEILVSYKFPFMLKDQFFCFNIWIFCFAAIFVIQYCSFDLNNNIKCDPSLESLKKKRSEIQPTRFPSTSKKLELISVNIFFLCAVNVGVMGSCDVDFWNLSFNQLISEFFNKIVQFKLSLKLLSHTFAPKGDSIILLASRLIGHVFAHKFKWDLNVSTYLWNYCHKVFLQTILWIQNFDFSCLKICLWSDGEVSGQILNMMLVNMILVFWGGVEPWLLLTTSLNY